MIPINFSLIFGPNDTAEVHKTLYKLDIDVDEELTDNQVENNAVELPQAKKGKQMVELRYTQALLIVISPPVLFNKFICERVGFMGWARVI